MLYLTCTCGFIVHVKTSGVRYAVMRFRSIKCHKTYNRGIMSTGGAETMIGFPTPRRLEALEWQKQSTCTQHGLELRAWSREPGVRVD